MIISLGCNCHPAYWLRKTGLASQSLPFDWLLTPAHLGLDYVVQVYRNRFADFLEDLKLNKRSHPVSSKYPNTELFHHHALINDDLRKRSEEEEKLSRRALRFMELVQEPVVFLYCYPVDVRSTRADRLARFSLSVDRLLEIFLHARLHVYLMYDTDNALPSEFISHRERFVVHSYKRDSSVDKLWGTEPEFLSGLGEVKEGLI